MKVNAGITSLTERMVSAFLPICRARPRATGIITATVPVLLITGGLLAPFELLKHLANIISYARIMAVGLTSAAQTSAFGSFLSEELGRGLGGPGRPHCSDRRGVWLLLRRLASIQERRASGDSLDHMVISSMERRQPVQRRACGWITQILMQGLSTSARFQMSRIWFIVMFC